MIEAVKVAAKVPAANKENNAPKTRKSEFSQSLNSPVEQVLFLQRTIGNQAVGRLIASGALQTKLKIGRPGDIYEQEADRVAEAVMRMPEHQVLKEIKVSSHILNHPIQRRCPRCIKGTKPKKEEEEQTIRTKEVSGSTPEVTTELESRISAIRGGGQPLPESVRDFFEPRFGHDFSQVQVHTDSKAAESVQAVNARAFTVGKDVVFGAGEYAPETNEGQRLLAHELTHVVQQRKIKKDQGSEIRVKESTEPIIQGGFWSWVGGKIEAGAEAAWGGAKWAGGKAAEGAEAAWRGAKWAGGKAAEGAEAAWRGAKWAGGKVAEGAEAAWRGAKWAGGKVAEGAERVVGKAGQLAQLIADAFGVSIRVTSAGLEISVPEVCPIDALPFKTSLSPLKKDYMVPVIELPIGPDLFISGEIGVTGSITPEVQIQLGPICLTGVHILINPITADYSISGGLRATAAASLGTEVRGGAKGQLSLKAIIPVGGVPVPVSAPLVGLEGGLAGKLRGIGAGTLKLGGGLSLSGRTISLNQRGQLDLGLGADLFLGAYGQLDIAGENVCRIYWQPIEWHGGIAASAAISAGLTLVLGRSPRIIFSIDPPTLDRIPFDQIPLAISRKGFSDDCPIKDRLCEILKSLHLLPSQNGGEWNWSGPYGPGNRLAGPLEVYEKNPGIPSGAECRGACGPDCKTCKAYPTYRYIDPATGDVWEYTNFQDCNSNKGCREHDAAFDWAADKKGEIGKWAIIMPWHMAANIECTCNNLAGNCIAWIVGFPPYDQKMYFADRAVKSTRAGTRTIHRVTVTGKTKIPLDEARRIVQAASVRIAKLVKERPDPKIDPDEAARIDRQIEEIERERSEALIQVVQADNPSVEVVDRKRGIFRVPVLDEQGRTRYVYGSILALWHLKEISPNIWKLSSEIGSITNEPGVTTRLSVAGTAAQSMVQPYPGDVDFVEEIDIRADTAIEAGRALARTVIEFVQRNSANPNLEFIYMAIMYRKGRSNTWTKEDILAAGRGGRAFERLAEQLASVDRNINTFWRTWMDGRFIDITKVLSVQAMTAGGEELFSTPRLGRVNAAYFDLPGGLPESSLGEFANAMMIQAHLLADKKKYLKAAKRAYNFFIVTGNLEAMQALEPAFRTDQAKVNQQATVIEAIVRSLKKDRLGGTTILTRDEAQRQLSAAADVIEKLPAAPGVTTSPREIAANIRALSGRLEADDSGLLKPNDGLSRELDGYHSSLKEHIDFGLEAIVRPVIDRYLPRK